ncbi:alpha-L-fucosidase, partial [Streptomyces sp. BE303]|uniref:alpha-L-fucosidase n=1 Tax=Streptomyces sp. BE303 TaxID=3002528 RepID=UPI003FA6BF35
RWFWSPNDTGTKPISTLVRNLVTNSAYNTNDLLNVGPRPDGTLVPVQEAALTTIGQWMNTNGASIHGASSS